MARTLAIGLLVLLSIAACHANPKYPAKSKPSKDKDYPSEKGYSKKPREIDDETVQVLKLSVQFTQSLRSQHGSDCDYVARAIVEGFTNNGVNNRKLQGGEGTLPPVQPPTINPVITVFSRVTKNRLPHSDQIATDYIYCIPYGNGGFAGITFYCSNTIVDEDGNTITFAGPLIPDPQNLLNFRYKQEVLGGTGIYGGARGQAYCQLQVTQNGQTAIADLEFAWTCKLVFTTQKSTVVKKY